MNLKGWDKLTPTISCRGRSGETKARREQSECRGKNVNVTSTPELGRRGDVKGGNSGDGFEQKEGGCTYTPH